MTIIGIKSFSGMESLSERMVQMMDTLFQALQAQSMSQGLWNPAMDLYETPEDYILLAEMAGVPRELLEIYLDGKTLRIAGNRETLIKGPIRYHQMEIPYGRFSRVFRLPSLVEENEVEAVSRDGMLMIRLPKKKVSPVYAIIVQPG